MKEIPENSIEQSKEQKKYTMEDFLAEMRELKGQQEKEHISQDLAGVVLDDLTERDRDMWQDLRDETITRESLGEYSRELLDDIGNYQEDVPEGRRAFSRFLNNKVQGVFVPRERKRDEEDVRRLKEDGVNL